MTPCIYIYIHTYTYTYIYTPIYRSPCTARYIYTPCISVSMYCPLYIYTLYIGLHVLPVIYIYTLYIGLHVLPVIYIHPIYRSPCTARYSCRILIKLDFSRHIFEKSSNIAFHENPPSRSRVVPCGRTDRQT